MRAALVALLVVPAAAGCADGDPRPATIAYLAPAILEPSCATASCHSEQAATSELVLEGDPAAIRAALAAKSLVHAGRPEHSPLVHLLRGDFTSLRMPPDGPLPEADIALIERWIADGAP
jgi:hypothetical protein